MSQNYEVRMRCPYGDTDTWVVLEKRSETLEEILKSSWDFECDTHGVQREFPMEARPVGAILPPAPEAAGFRPAALKTQEKGEVPSEDQPVCVPVVIYGWSKKHGTFHEETFTVETNASGAVVLLKASLEIGERCFLLNRKTHREREVRVVHVDPETMDDNRIAIAFRQPDADFWEAPKRRPRVPAVYRVHIAGVDRNDHPFAQTAYTVDISKNGARLDGGSQLTRPGQVIEVKRRWHGKARYRVVWVGQIGLEYANHIGIWCLEPDKNIWGIALPEAGPDGPTKDSTAPKKKRSG